MRVCAGLLNLRSVTAQTEDRLFELITSEIWD